MSAGAVIAGAPDAPPAMLIHGLGSSYRVWDRVVPLIEPAARIYAVELEGTKSIEYDANAVAALIKTPTVLVGHSRGGLVATAIAERHPGLVRKLILICTPWSLASRLSAKRPIERAVAIPGMATCCGHWLPAPGNEPRFKAPSPPEHPCQTSSSPTSAPEDDATSSTAPAPSTTTSEPPRSPTA